MNKILIILLCVLSGNAFSQQELFHFPKGPASWIISCSKATSSRLPADQNQDVAPNAGQSQPILPEKIEVEQSQTLMRSVIHYSNGRKQELWSVPQFDVILTEDPSGTAFVTKEKTMNQSPFGVSDFSWIDRETRVGENSVKFDGIDCYYYKGFMVVPNPFSHTDKPQTVACEAWIDAKTQLPVAMKKGDLVGRFIYGDPPASLEIPEKFQKRLDYYKVTMGIP